MRTEVPFTLPMGYVVGNGNVHRDGRMRLATARDEIEPLGDAEVRQNQAYLSVLLLSAIVVRSAQSEAATCDATGCSAALAAAPGLLVNDIFHDANGMTGTSLPPTDLGNKRFF